MTCQYSSYICSFNRYGYVGREQTTAIGFISKRVFRRQIESDPANSGQAIRFANNVDYYDFWMALEDQHLEGLAVAINGVPKAVMYLDGQGGVLPVFMDRMAKNQLPDSYQRQDYMFPCPPEPQPEPPPPPTDCKADACRVDCADAPNGFCCIPHSLIARLSKSLRG